MNIFWTYLHARERTFLTAQPLTLCADGRDLFTIQQYSMAVWSMHTLKMGVDRMVGCLGIVAMGSSHIYWPLSGLMMSPPDLKGDIKRLIQKLGKTIERAFSLWKSRFWCLDVSGGALQFNPNRCCTFITATAVLHNMCIYLTNTTPWSYRATPSWTRLGDWGTSSPS